MDTHQLHKASECKDMVAIAVPFENNEETADINTQEVPGAHIPSISIEAYKKCTKNNIDVLQNLIIMTIESFTLYKNEYKELIEKRNVKEVGLLTHKLKLTSNLLSATKLEEVIKETRALLSQGIDDDYILQQAIKSIHFEFDKCIDELQIALLELPSVS